MKKEQKKSKKVVKEVKNADSKLSEAYKNAKGKLSLETNKSYISLLGEIDGRIKLLSNEISKNTEFEPWDRDIYMEKNFYEEIRKNFAINIIRKMKPDGEITDLLLSETEEKINELPVEKLKKRNILEFCIMYKKGYKKGLLPKEETINILKKETKKRFLRKK